MYKFKYKSDAMSRLVDSFIDKILDGVLKGSRNARYSQVIAPELLSTHLDMWDPEASFYWIPHCSFRYDGAILIAPMVKISDKLKPPEFVTRLFSRVARHLPLAPIAPTKDVLDGCFQDKELVKEERCDCVDFSCGGGGHFFFLFWKLSVQKKAARHMRFLMCIHPLVTL